MENELVYIGKSFIVLIFVIFAINYLLKLLDRFVNKNGKYITMIERIPLNRTSSLCVVKVSDSYFLMSCTDTKNEILKELTIEEIKEEKTVLDPKLHKKLRPNSPIAFEDMDESIVISRRGMRK
ncbi:flagellar biosynthetic protein FliO [uncultured Trichococcus sp.]|uniref:flagellar biosynthetic protein FliO n=1 Tax=uncultured Trichococcus sp. TaxID=189665 RepID=UPI002A18C5C0|nr:flagellar biosynthetic protein FliO [uncultured Trichococcus sp.]